MNQKELEKKIDEMARKKSIIKKSVEKIILDELKKVAEEILYES